MIDVIEALVWTPDELGDPERQQAEQLVASDPVAQDLFEFLSAVRAEMMEDVADLPTTVQTFVESLYTPPRRIPLRMKREVDRDVKTQTALRTNMAAATSTRNTRFRSLGSMLNREEGILVRFLLDEDAGCVRGYILSTSGVDIGTSLVVFGGHERPICPSGNGMFSFPSSWIKSPGSLADLDVDLLLPVASLSFENHPEDFTVRDPATGNVIVTFTVEDQSLFPEFPDYEAGYVTFTPDGGKTICVEKGQRMTCLPGVRCTIRAYSLNKM